MIRLTFDDNLTRHVWVNPAHIVSFFEFNGKTHVFTVLHDPSIDEDEGMVVTETPDTISRRIIETQMFIGTASQ